MWKKKKSKGSNHISPFCELCIGFRYILKVAVTYVVILFISLVPDVNKCWVFNTSYLVLFATLGFYLFAYAMIFRNDSVHIQIFTNFKALHHWNILIEFSLFGLLRHISFGNRKIFLRESYGNSSIKFRKLLAISLFIKEQKQQCLLK